MNSTPKRGPFARRLPLILLAVAAVLVAAVGIFLVEGRFVPGSSSSGTALIGGPFELVDQKGQTVTDANFRGKLMLVFFGYTYCPDVCPTTLANVGSAIDRLSPAERAKFVPVFITIDPERDTPDQIGEYVENFSPLMIGLTGTQEQITRAERAYRVYAKKGEDQGGGAYAMDHSSILYLMGRDGKYLANLPGSASPTEIADIIRKFL